LPNFKNNNNSYGGPPGNERAIFISINLQSQNCCTMKQSLSPEAFDSLKKSYFNILALFLGDKTIESRFVTCLLKWGFQLGLSRDDLNHAGKDLGQQPFSKPTDRVETFESIYHLVYMIQLDNVVEDVELEIATRYAIQLGFSPAMVAELFKSITTQAYDGTQFQDVRKEVIDFLKTNSF